MCDPNAEAARAEAALQPPDLMCLHVIYVGGQFPHCRVPGPQNNRYLSLMKCADPLEHAGFCSSDTWILDSAHAFLLPAAVLVLYFVPLVKDLTQQCSGRGRIFLVPGSVRQMPVILALALLKKFFIGGAGEGGGCGEVVPPWANAQATSDCLAVPRKQVPCPTHSYSNFVIVPSPLTFLN